MTTIPQVARALRQILTTTAAAAGRATRCVQCPSPLHGATVRQTWGGWVARQAPGAPRSAPPHRGRLGRRAAPPSASATLARVGGARPAPAPLDRQRPGGSRRRRAPGPCWSGCQRSLGTRALPASCPRSSRPRGTAVVGARRPAPAPRARARPAGSEGPGASPSSARRDAPRRVRHASPGRGPPGLCGGPPWARGGGRRVPRWRSPRGLGGHGARGRRRWTRPPETAESSAHAGRAKPRTRAPWPSRGASASGERRVWGPCGARRMAPRPAGGACGRRPVPQAARAGPPGWRWPPGPSA